MKKILFLMTFLLVSNVFANFQALNQTLGVSTMKDLPKNCHAIEKEEHYIKLSGTCFNMQGLNSAEFSYFSDDKTLARIVLNMNKNKKDSIIASLDKKYKSVERQVPFVGNAHVRWEH